MSTTVRSIRDSGLRTDAGIPADDRARRMVSVTPCIGPWVVCRPAELNARSIVEVMASMSKGGSLDASVWFMVELVGLCVE